jgi:predicted KAP-like P-loop ATPase
LARLEDHTESDIPSDVIPNAIKGLLLAGDELLRAEPERVNFLEFGIDVQITRVAWQLLRRIQADQRYQVISAGAQEAGIAILVHWVDSLLAQHQPGRDERVRKNPILSSAETETLRATAVRRVQAAAIEGTLDRVPHLPTILARWREWGDKDEMQRWLDRRLNDPEFVALLVPQYVQHTLSMGQSDKAVRKTPRIDLKWVARAVDVNQLLVRVQGALTAEHRPDVRNAFLLYVGTATGEIKDRD